MKHRGVEYRILENETKDSYKVEIKDGSFMGFDQWKPLLEVIRYLNPSLTSMWRDYTIKPLPDRPHAQSVTCIASFDSCAKAKQAAEIFIDEPFRDKWHECKC